jgi:hypothetical protein
MHASPRLSTGWLMARRSRPARPMDGGDGVDGHRSGRRTRRGSRPSAWRRWRWRARVGGDLDAGHEEQRRVAGLRRADEVELRDGVVLGELDEIEAAAAGEGGHLVERRARVAALPGVHVEVSRVPARARGERGRVGVGAPLGLRGERGGRAEEDLDVVARGPLDHLRLADEERPRTRGDGAGDVAPGGGLDGDDGGLGVAAAPAAEARRVGEAPVEDVHLGAVVVAHLDLADALRHREGHREVAGVPSGIAAVEHDGRLRRGGRAREREREGTTEGRAHHARW